LRLNINPDPNPKSKIGKNLQQKKLNIFLIKNCTLPFLMPPKSTSKLQKKPTALEREHPGHFLPPGSGYGCGSTDLISNRCIVTTSVKDRIT
jgi:hypothetical protein